MSTVAKVMWGEGLFLRPQHFQQQDLYHEARLRQTAHALHPCLWGVRGVEWDGAALKAGKLRLLALSAIFRDGALVDAPASDPLPPAVDLSVLPPSLQEVVVHAALPWLAPGAQRYASCERQAEDLYTAAAPVQMAFLRSAVRLAPDLEPLGGGESFPLVRLRRVASGGWEIDQDFIPPGVSVESAPRLRALLEQLLDALEAKINALQGHMREPTRNVIEFRSGDVSSFWLLHTASTAAATLTHYLHHPQLHPERLFEAMLGLAGSLMTYSKAYGLSNLPAYAHERQGECFGRLDAIIRDLLDTVISSRYFGIALSEDRPGYHRGKLDSGKIDHKTVLYLAVAAAMPALELVDVVPLRLKAGAPDDVDKCVMSAMPGVKLVHAPQVPPAIPVRPDTYYFALDARSALYEQMLKAQSISVYVPAGMHELRLELIAVTA